MPTKITLTPMQVLQVATLAECDPATVRKELRGKPGRVTTRARVRRAIDRVLSGKKK